MTSTNYNMSQPTRMYCREVCLSSVSFDISITKGNGVGKIADVACRTDLGYLARKMKVKSPVCLSVCQESNALKYCRIFTQILSRNFSDKNQRVAPYSLLLTTTVYLLHVVLNLVQKDRRLPAVGLRFSACPNILL